MARAGSADFDAWERQVHRSGCCLNPVRLTGTIHSAGGEVVLNTNDLPGFGAVHTIANDGRCRIHAGERLCRHGRPMRCRTRHHVTDELLGVPLCGGCYDTIAHVLFNHHAGLLWRRFTTYLRRHLAAQVGMAQAAFNTEVRVSYGQSRRVPASRRHPLPRHHPPR